MNVIPDVLGRIEPRADLRVVLQRGFVEPGSYLKPNQVRLLLTLR